MKKKGQTQAKRNQHSIIGICCSTRLEKTPRGEVLGVRENI